LHHKPLPLKSRDAIRFFIQGKDELVLHDDGTITKVLGDSPKKIIGSDNQVLALNTEWNRKWIMLVFNEKSNKEYCTTINPKLKSESIIKESVGIILNLKKKLAYISEKEVRKKIFSISNTNIYSKQFIKGDFSIESRLAIEDLVFHAFLKIIYEKTDELDRELKNSCFRYIKHCILALKSEEKRKTLLGKYNKYIHRKTLETVIKAFEKFTIVE
jgi:hypothetical protein